jgi:transposase
MTTLADHLVPDQLWAIVEPLLAPPPRPPYGGRHRTISDRNCFAAIVFMARTSTPWRLLPAQELGCGSPSTAWRRLAEWAKAGVFEQLHLDILDRLGERGRLDWSRASVDSASVRAKRGGPRWRNPVDRGKPGSKIHLACEGGGLPLTAVVSAANVADVTMLEAVVDDIPPVRAPSGRRRTRPGKLDADKGYESAGNRVWLRAVGSPHGSPAVGSSRRPGWGGIAGGWSGRCRGCRAIGGWRCGGIGARSGSWRSCCWHVPLFASTGCRRPAGARRGRC